MAATREELRDHLTAVIEAAKELPREDRSFLADSFLDELEMQYQLVPRSQATRWEEPAPSRFRLAGSPFAWVAAILASLFVLPVVFLSFFVLLHVLFHPPIFLLAIVLLLLFRFGRPGMRRRGPWGRGPGGANMSNYRF